MDWFVCKPKQVIETLGRQIHVECQNSLMLSFDGSARTISFIAILASDPAADRFQALATAAVVSDKPFLAYVTGDPATNVAGCGEQDCRTPIYYGLGSAF